MRKHARSTSNVVGSPAETQTDQDFAVHLISARSLVLPAAALAVIVALAQTQGASGTRVSDAVTVPIRCAAAPSIDTSCTMALNTTGTIVLR